MEIPETYASPNMRHALFLQDHPSAPQPEFWEGPGTDAGLPDAPWAKRPHCICKLSYGPNEGLEDVFGAKLIKGKVDDSDEWEKISTKALGRALKRAGYPDDIKDLRARLAYATALAKNEAIRAGAADTTEDAGKVIAAAATTPEAAETEREEPKVSAHTLARQEASVRSQINEAEAKSRLNAGVQNVPASQESNPEPTPEPDGPSQPELSLVQGGEDPGPWTDEEIQGLRVELNNLSKAEQANFTNFLTEQGIEGKAFDWSNEQLDKVEAWLRGDTPS